MIVVINGPLGVGKSETSWGVFERFDKAVLLDIDYIAAFKPLDFYNPLHITYAYQTLTHLLGFHITNGYRNYVINWVFETPEILQQLIDCLTPFDLPVSIFWLDCERQEIHNRIRKRGLPDWELEIRRANELVDILDNSARKGYIGSRLDTTNLTLVDVVERIWFKLQKTD